MAKTYFKQAQPDIEAVRRQLRLKFKLKA